MSKEEKTKIEELLLRPVDRQSIDKFLENLFSELKMYTTLDGRFLEYVTANKLTTNDYYLDACEQVKT